MREPQAQCDSVDNYVTDEMLFREERDLGLGEDDALPLERGTGADDMRLTITPGGRKCKSWRTCED